MITSPLLFINKGQLTQLVECWSYEPDVTGSNPVLSTLQITKFVMYFIIL